MEFPRTSFYEASSIREYGKPILYDITEEDYCEDLPDEIQDPLDSIIDSTFSSKKDDSDFSLLSSFQSEAGSITSGEKDVFGRETTMPSTWKIRPENYGKVYNLMSGAPVDCKPPPSDSMLSSSQVAYLELLYTNQEEENFEDLLSSAKCQDFRCGDKFKIPQNCLYRFSNQEQLNCLTTLDIQSTVCAALNSKVRLLWLIGADSNGKIHGCYLPYTERDCFRQGLDYSLSTEFVPALNSELVDIKFHQINTVPDLFLIEISINKSVSTLYQLSSGRIFYNNHGTPTKLSSVNEARLMLLDRKAAENPEMPKNNSTVKLLQAPPILKNSSAKNFFYFALAFSSGALFSYTICKRFK